MYNEIEKLYEEKSPYNIIKKILIIIYFGGMFILSIFNNSDIIISAAFIFISIVICIRILVDIILMIISKINGVNLTLPQLIRNKELELFKNYSLEKNIYNEKSYLCIIDHYKNLIKPKMVDINLLSFLSFCVPIVLNFCSKDGFNSEGFYNALPQILGFIIVIIILYFLFNKFIELIKFFKGEDGMYERLEEIFSELYIECINNKDNMKKDSKESIIKKVLKKLKVIK